MNDELQWSLSAFTQREQDYELYRHYYYGQHRLAFATDKFRNAFGALLRSFSDNLCQAIVDIIVDRLQISGFSGPQAAEAQALWDALSMTRLSGEAHLEALRSGDAYIIVWQDAAQKPHFWLNGGAFVRVRYDEEDPSHIVAASKAWRRQEDKRWRLNLYFPDRIEKYLSGEARDSLPEKSAAMRQYSDDNEAWPLPNPWGQVPVIHLANNAGLGEAGHSELQPLIPIQDALNKSVMDMLIAMEYVAFPQRWITGVDIPNDEQGHPIPPFQAGVDRVWSVSSELARFGEFGQADLGQFTAVQDSLRAEIARISGVPMHYLMLGSSDFPSGEAMKTAEARLLAKVHDRQLAFGEAWKNALTLGLRMGGLANPVLDCLWVDPTPRNERDKAETTLIKKQLGISEKQALLELGYTEEQVQTMQLDRETDGASMGETMLTAFDRGQ